MITDEADAKKSKTDTHVDSITITNFVFKKPLPVAPKPKKTALEEVREVIY
jgi:hypothetical protein